MCNEIFYIKEAEPPPAVYIYAGKQYCAVLCYNCALRVLQYIREHKRRRISYIT